MHRIEEERYLRPHETEDVRRGARGRRHPDPGRDRAGGRGARWTYGLPVETQELTCQSIGAGGIVGARTEPGTSVRAGVLIDAAAPPRVGDVFYAAVTMAAVGGCASKVAQPEAVLPAGVELAISPATPVRCSYTIAGGPATPIVEGCPQAPRSGAYGLSLTPQGDPARAWSNIGQVPGAPNLSRPQNEVLTIEFPPRASRPLVGLSGAPSCPERAQATGSCPAAAAGDFLQVAVRVASVGTRATLAPAIGLTVASAATAPGPVPVPTPRAPTPTPVVPAPSVTPRLLTAPASLRVARALRGVPVTVAVPAAPAPCACACGRPAARRGDCAGHAP